MSLKNSEPPVLRADDLPLYFNAVDILERNLADRAKKVALYSKERELTFKQVSEEANRVGNALIKLGAGFGDVVRTVTYTTDVEEYFRCQAVRFEYFTHPAPTSTLLGVPRLADPDFLVEIEAEAVIGADRLRLP